MPGKFDKFISNMQNTVDQVSSTYEKVTKPRISTDRLNLSAKFEPTADVGWNPSGNFTPWGSPNINLGGKVNLRGDYDITDKINVFGNANWETGTSPTYGLGATFNFQHQGTVEYKKYYDWIKSQEGTDAVMKKTPSLIKKDDGTYYNALEDGIYYPYEDHVGKKTIGFGRQNSNVVTDYPSGISIEKAHDFLKEDIKNKFSDTKRKYENKYGKESFDKLTKTEQFMLSDYVYNLGYLFPKFTDAIRSGDTKEALKEYKRYSYENKGTKNEIKKSLGRNDDYLEQYLQPWISTKGETNPVLQNTGNVKYPDIYNMNVEVDAFAKEYAQSENFKSMLLGQGYKEKDIQYIIDDIMAFNPDKNITYDTDNPSAGTAYNPAFSFSSGEETRAPAFTDEGITNINYNPEAGPPNHPFFNLWEQIVGHEGGHLGFMKGNLNRKTRKALKSLIYPDSGEDIYNNLRDAGVSRRDAKHAVRHAEDPYEMRANLFQLRYQLHKAGIYNSFDIARDGDNEFTIDHLKEIIEFDEEGRFEKYKDEYQNEMFNNVHPQDIIWMMNNIAQNQEIGDDLPEGTMRAQQGGPIGNMIRKRLAENLYPVGYSGSSVDSEGNVERFGPVTKILNALKGKKDASIMQHNLKQEIDPKKYNAIINEREDFLQILMGQNQKHNSVIKSKYKPSDSKDKDTVYYTSPYTEQHIKNWLAGEGNIFKVLDDENPMFPAEPAEGIDAGKGDQKPWIVDLNPDFAGRQVVGLDGPGTLANFTLDRGVDKEGREYVSYYDTWDLDPFDNNTLNKISKSVQSSVGINVPEIYGRIYLDEIENTSSEESPSSKKYQTGTNVFTPTLTFPPPPEDKNIASMLDWISEKEKILNDSNLSPYQKELELAYVDKRGRFQDRQHTNKIKHGDPLFLPYNVKWGSDPSHRENYIFSRDLSQETEIAEWEEMLKTLEGHPEYKPTEEVNVTQKMQNKGTVGRCSGGNCEDSYPKVSGHYIFNDDESRGIGLEGAPDGTSATLLWEDGGPEVRTLYGKQSYPVAVYADGLYQGILEPGQVLYTNPSMRVDEIPLGYMPNTSTSEYFSSMETTNKTDYTNQYNTELDKDQQLLYEMFKKEFEIKDDTEKDTDLKGIFANGDYKELEGFTEEKFRKPNHPLFTNNSLYHNIEKGMIGGEFQGNTFNPSKTNMEHNSIDMLLNSLSTTGGELALAPYFQESALNPVNYEEEISNNYDELTNARNTRQLLEKGGQVYNDLDNTIQSLVRKNRKLRRSFESANTYKNKMSKYQSTGQVDEKQQSSSWDTYSPYVLYVNPETGDNYTLGDAYEKGKGHWYFKTGNDDQKYRNNDYKIDVYSEEGKALINQIQQLKNFTTLEDNWSTIYGDDDELKIDLQNPNSWSDKETIAFHKLNQIPGFEKIDITHSHRDPTPDDLRKTYNFAQNDPLWKNLAKPGLSAVKWLGETMVPTNMTDLMMIVGGGVAANKIFKYASKSPRIRKWLGLSPQQVTNIKSGKTSPQDILKNSPGVNVTVGPTGVATTSGAPRIGKIGKMQTKIMIDGVEGVGMRYPVSDKMWKNKLQPYLENYIAKRASYYRSPQVINQEMRNLYPQYFDKMGRVRNQYKALHDNHKLVLENNINRHIQSMDNNININFKHRPEGSRTLGSFRHNVKNKKSSYDLDVYWDKNQSMKEWMNTIEHEINHAFSAAGRYPNRSYGFIANSMTPQRMYGMGTSYSGKNLKNTVGTRYWDPKTTSEHINYKPIKDYENYHMLEVDGSLRGRYGDGNIKLNVDGEPNWFPKDANGIRNTAKPIGQPIILESKTGQQLLNEMEKNIIRYTQNLEKRMGPKSGWTKQDLKDYDLWVSDQKVILEGQYGKITPNKNYVTKSMVDDLGRDDWQYLMLPQEQQVRAMTARDIINKYHRRNNLKLGDYTEEHAKFLRDHLYDKNKFGKYISNDIGPQDLNHLYSNLRAGGGGKLDVGSEEWLKVITSHLNKAFGVAGVGTVATQVE